MSLAAGTRLGPYEVQSLIGAGGMGEVYKARDSRLGRTVAIKILPAAFASDSERRRRFEQEARAVSALNHPHICVLHDIGTAQAPPCRAQPAPSGTKSRTFSTMFTRSETRNAGRKRLSRCDYPGLDGIGTRVRIRMASNCKLQEDRASRAALSRLRTGGSH